jgi:hypothetical protein
MHPDLIQSAFALGARDGCHGVVCCVRVVVTVVAGAGMATVVVRCDVVVVSVVGADPQAGSRKMQPSNAAAAVSRMADFGCALNAPATADPLSGRGAGAGIVCRGDCDRRRIGCRLRLAVGRHTVTVAVGRRSYCAPEQPDLTPMTILDHYFV